MAQKTYRGDRTIDGIAVYVDDKPLPNRTDIRTLSRDGFEWSYEGEAPAQLALSLLADHFGSAEPALRHYDRFMREVVANFANEWELTTADVEAALGARVG